MAEEEEEAGGILHTEVKNKSYDAFANLARGLTSEELLQSGTQKMILSHLTRTEETVNILTPYQKKYYEVLTEKCVLDEKLSKTKRSEILYSFCITGGGLIIGLGKSSLSMDQTTGIIQIIFGGLLLIGGLLFKIIVKK